jgi:hypothetical protein
MSLTKALEGIQERDDEIYFQDIGRQWRGYPDRVIVNTFSPLQAGQGSRSKYETSSLSLRTSDWGVFPY